MSVNPLTADELHHPCDPASLPFETTAELEHIDGVIEQDRARQALQFGLSIKNRNYNIYVAGHSGTGKLSMVRGLLKEIANKDAAPPDWCYVHNFKRPEEPFALELPKGDAVIFKKEMKAFVDDLKSELPKAFQSKDHQQRVHEILNRGLERENDQFASLTRQAKELGFVLKSTKNGLMTIPEVEGKPLSGKDYNSLPDDQRKAIEERRSQLDPQISEFMQVSRDLERSARDEIKAEQRALALGVVSPRIALFVKKYEKHEVLPGYLQAMQDDILENLDRFVPDLRGEDAPRAPRPTFTEYEVNVVVDNSDTEGAPVIFETRPSYYNMLGRIEKRVEYGIYSTDFTMIKAGSLLRANGGFLIVQAHDLLMQPLCWQALKNVIKLEEIRIEDIGEHLNLLPTSGLRPQPIKVQVKVILVGSRYLYQLLYHYDEDFRKVFQIKADFDFEIERGDKTLHEFSRFIGTACRKEGLPPMHRDAVAVTVDYGSRMVEHKERVTLRFNDISNLVVESGFFAQEEKAEVIQRQHVEKAIQQREYRNSLIFEKMQREILDGNIMVDTAGERIGQINGLAVYQLGDHAFGMPARITAQTFAGKGGIVNIDRAAKLAGDIQHKGVLILSGYLGERFAHKKPLALSVSLTFEQSYSMIDGDSASAAELFAILSSLAEAPIAQRFAVTGSVNQFGAIQPIGGVNHKIEGFFELCRERGLDGQGVLIPVQNVRNLMLKKEVVEAVREGRFQILPIRTIEEGIELLTGVAAGVRDAKGNYPRNSIYARVAKKLDAFRAAEKAASPGKKRAGKKR